MNNKYTSLICALTLFTLTGHAQITSGIITYDETIHMNVELPPEAAQFRNAFPRESHVTHVLTFTPEASVYAAVPAKEKPQPKTTAPVEGGTVLLTTNIKTPEDVIYTDLKAGRVIEQRDLFSRKFLISADTKKRAWHNTGRQKTILGYSCQEANSITDKDTITAWFTTAIPISSGPNDWAGLPGMILEAAASGESQISIVATKIEEGLVDKPSPAAPTSGKKVSREEYAAIEAAKRKEIAEQFGGKGNVIIHINEN